MSLLDILYYPDPRLRTQAARVELFDAALKQFTQDLLETMYDAPGIGLAATQVDVHQRIIAVDVSDGSNEPHIFINPKLVTSGEQIELEEGCLSVPGFYEPVTRYENVHVKAVDASGKAIDYEASGLLAVCIQHECDHLEGKLFVDYLSGLKRNRIRKKLVKLSKNSSPT